MKFEAFMGGSYESQSTIADCERTINWYPEKLQIPRATAQRVLYPTPGVELLYSADDDLNANLVGGPGRAHYVTGGREYAIIGTGFWELFRDRIEFLGQLSADADDGLPATINSNGDAGGQLFITSAGKGFVYNIAAGTLVSIPALAGKAQFGGYVDGYFLDLDTTTSTLYVSALYDGSTWNTGTEFAQRSLAADPWVSMIVGGRTVWLFGEHTSEPWFNTGARFPLAPAPTGVIPFGIMAPWSAETLGNDVFWQGTSRDGRSSVLRVSGYDAQRVSTYPLETKMQGYASLTSTVADAYADSGHSFYLLNFDRDDVTWAYDSETGLWSERGTWIPESNRYVSWRPRFYAYAFNEHRMLDTSNGNVYRMSPELTRDVDGRLIRRLRRAPAVSNENKRVFYSGFELDLEPGLGIDGCQVGFTMAEQALQADFTIDGETLCEGSTPCATLTPTVTGGSGNYSFAWSGWSELGGSEASPAFTSTDQVGAWLHGGAICIGFVKLVVTDNVTSAGVTIGAGGSRPFTSHCA